MSIITCKGHDFKSNPEKQSQRCDNYEETYEGAVLATYERNGYDDSDFYAIVWDAEQQRIMHVEYASTRGWTYHNSATVDATEAVKDQAQAKLAMMLKDDFMSKAEAEAQNVMVKGVEVKSTTTRGKNVGIVGIVKWFGKDTYNSSQWLTKYRVGIKVEGEDKLRYMSADKLKRTHPDKVSEADVAQHAGSVANQMRQDDRWRYAVEIAGQLVY